jgi:hypothetical membrane protein
MAQSVEKSSQHSRQVLSGSLFWLMSAQYFIVQILVGFAYKHTYSLRSNTISDLGNTACSTYRHIIVCSPLHVGMNISFVLLGLTMIVGAVLLEQGFSKQPIHTLGFICMGLSGLGSILVGLFPENTISAIHITGAGLVFLFGNIALLLLGATLQMPRPLRYYTLLSGAIALGSLLLFLAHWHLGLGIGGVERLTAYPQTVWMIVYGVYTLATSRKLPRS